MDKEINLDLIWFAEVGDILIDHSDNKFKVIDVNEDEIELKCVKNNIRFKNTVKFFRRNIKHIKKAK